MSENLRKHLPLQKTGNIDNERWQIQRALDATALDLDSLPGTLPDGSIELTKLEDIPSTSIVCRTSSSGSGPVGTIQLGNFSVLTRPGAADMVSTFIDTDEVLGRDGGGAIQGIKVTADHMDDIPGDSVLLNPTGTSGPVVAHAMADNSVLARVGTMDVDGLQAVGPGQVLRTSGGGNNIGWGQLTGGHLVDGAIFTAKIQDTAVTLAKLATDVYQSAVVELGGDFTGGEEVKCVRIGDQVTITGVGANLAHSSSSLPASGATVIPAAFRPTNNVVNEYGKSATELRSIIVTSGGQLFLSYRDYSGSNTSRTDSGSPPIITYNIT